MTNWERLLDTVRQGEKSSTSWGTVNEVGQWAPTDQQVTVDELGRPLPGFEQRTTQGKSLDSYLFPGQMKQQLAQIAQVAGLPANFDWTPYATAALQEHVNQFNFVYGDPRYTNQAASLTSVVTQAAQQNPALQRVLPQISEGSDFWQKGEADRQAAAEAGKSNSHEDAWGLASVFGGAALAGLGAAGAGAGGGALTGESAALASNIGGAGGLGLTAGEAAALGTGAASVAAPSSAVGSTSGALSQADLAALIENGTVGAEGGALEAAAGITPGALPTASTVTGALEPAAPPPAQTPIPPATPTPATGLTAGQVSAGASAVGALNGLSQSDAAALAESGTAGTAGAAIESTALGTQNIDQFLATLPAATQGILTQLGLGSASEALGKLMKLGLPIATIAGLLEKPNNPLLEPIVQAAQKAIGQADKFAALGPIGLTPAQEQAIALAKANVGNYQPYLDKSGALADKAAGGIQQSEIDRYLNPYLDDVLSNSIRDIENSAARRRESLRAITSRSGNDLRTPSTVPNRFNVEDDLLDKSTFQTIGDLSAKTRATGYDTATGLAGKDLDRATASSNIYGGLGKAAGALGATDVAGLTTAGALERQPLEDVRNQTADASKLYTSVVQGNQGALSAAAQPSTLTNVTGALGALKSAKDIGLY